MSTVAAAQAGVYPGENAVTDGAQATVLAVCRHSNHGFSKSPQPVIRLIAGQGVEGDAHCGITVQHLYLKRRNPHEPNLMQVHLLQSELFDDLARAGYPLSAGDLGENVTTRGVDLLTLPLGTCLYLGDEAVVRLTGLRTPCRKMDGLQPGLMQQMKIGLAAGVPARAGVMAVVLHGGDVRAGDRMKIVCPEESAWEPLRLI